MVYNFQGWIKAQFPALPVYVNGFQAGSPDDAFEMNEGAGEDQSLYKRQDTLIQFISRATIKTAARRNAIDVYNYIRKRFRCEFPSITVDNVVYPAVTAWAIRPVNKPQYIGDDENGRSLFSFSVEVTTNTSEVQ